MPNRISLRQGSLPPYCFCGGWQTLNCTSGAMSLNWHHWLYSLIKYNAAYFITCIEVCFGYKCNHWMQQASLDAVWVSVVEIVGLQDQLPQSCRLHLSVLGSLIEVHPDSVIGTTMHCRIAFNYCCMQWAHWLMLPDHANCILPVAIRVAVRWKWVNEYWVCPQSSLFVSNGWHS